MWATARSGANTFSGDVRQALGAVLLQLNTATRQPALDKLLL